MLLYYPFVMSLSGIWVFVSKRKHLLITLLSLEYVVLSLFLLMGLWLGEVLGEMFILLVFLTFAACEGSVGLGILVSLIRSHGNDNFGSFSVLQC